MKHYYPRGCHHAFALNICSSTETLRFSSLLRDPGEGNYDIALIHTAKLSQSLSIMATKKGNRDSHLHTGYALLSIKASTVTEKFFLRNISRSMPSCSLNSGSVDLNDPRPFDIDPWLSRRQITFSDSSDVFVKLQRSKAIHGQPLHL